MPGTCSRFAGFILVGRRAVASEAERLVRTIFGDELNSGFLEGRLNFRQCIKPDWAAIRSQLPKPRTLIGPTPWST